VRNKRDGEGERTTEVEKEDANQLVLSCPATPSLRTLSIALIPFVRVLRIAVTSFLSTHTTQEPFPSILIISLFQGIFLKEQKLFWWRNKRRLQGWAFPFDTGDKEVKDQKTSYERGEEWGGAEGSVEGRQISERGRTQAMTGMCFVLLDGVWVWGLVALRTFRGAFFLLHLFFWFWFCVFLTFPYKNVLCS
jgi:hypothetical protein